MRQMRKAVLTSLPALFMILAMILAMTLTAHAATYHSGTVKLSELETGDIISRGAKINRASSENVKDTIVLKAKGYYEYDDDYSRNENASCSSNIKLPFRNYDDNYKPGWQYDYGTARFTWRGKGANEGGYYGPAADDCAVSSWIVTNKAGDEANGFTVTLAGCIVYNGELTAGRNENVVFGEFGDSTYSFIPDKSGIYNFYSDIGDSEDDESAAWGILKNGNVTIAENKPMWEGDFSFTCELNAGTTYTFYAINDGSDGSPAFTATVVVEKDNSDLYNIKTVNNRYVQVLTDKSTAFPDDTVTVKAWPKGSYSPIAYVRKTSDGSLIKKVELEYNGQTFTGTFTMPKCDVTVEGKAGGADDSTKEDNTLSVTGKTVTVNHNTLKKILPANKVMTFKNKGQGTLKFTLTSAKKGEKSFKKYFNVNSKTGTITVKKGLKNGIYKLTVKVQAAGNDEYNKAEKKVNIKIRIK